MEAIKFRDICMDAGRLIIDIPQDQRGLAMKFIRSKKDRLYELVIKEHRNKRSLDANAKMWALINEMAQILKLTPEEIYQGYIPDVPNNYWIAPVKPEDIQQTDKDWCHGHIGRMTQDMGPCRLPDLRGYHSLKMYRGSSEYDTVQFSRLLDLVIQDCRQLGIETMSEREKSLLLEQWEDTAHEN